MNKDLKKEIDEITEDIKNLNIRLKSLQDLASKPQIKRKNSDPLTIRERVVVTNNYKSHSGTTGTIVKLTKNLTMEKQLFALTRKT
jgi:hypothetical protein